MGKRNPGHAYTGRTKRMVRHRGVERCPKSIARINEDHQRAQRIGGEVSAAEAQRLIAEHFNRR